jgi:acetylornithine deacetylase/succinyl-diaminopimelate desuccinylase-like protein
LCFVALASQAAALDADQIRALAKAQRADAMALYREFLALPNDANHPEEILKLVAWLEPQFARRGFATRRLATGGSPVLFGARTVPHPRGTVLVYLQADGQPVDASRWDQPDPYEAVLKVRDAGDRWHAIDWPQHPDGLDSDARVFARSASDSKGPMTQFFAALDALDAAQIALGYDLKVIVDTEEELGSPHLSAAVLAHRDLLAADFLLVFDGPPHASNAPTVTLGARGITTMTLTTYGPKVPQHSGHYGNFLPNPAFDLARILASLKTPDGRVAIEGFYDGVTLTDDVRELLVRVPDDERRILADRGVAKPESVAGSLQEALQYPSLNIRGLSSAWVGKEARTIIPATAVAELDIRTVVESDPGHLVELVREHIRSLGFHVLDRAPTDQERLTRAPLVTMTYEISYGAFRSSIDSPAGLMARAGMRKLHGHEPILIRTMGGSVPIAPFVNALDIPAALVPTVNVDNNQHSPNENLRVGNFFDGIEILIAVLLSGPQ